MLHLTNYSDGTSTSGFLIKIFGDVVHWRTKKQGHVALFSAEAEYIAMSLVIREVTAIRVMCEELLKLQILPTLFKDNKSAICCAKSYETPSLKHLMKLNFHYIRQEVKQRNVHIQWISTNIQLGDFFTKALAYPKFSEFYYQFLLKKTL